MYNRLQEQVHIGESLSPLSLFVFVNFGSSEEFTMNQKHNNSTRSNTKA